MSDNQNVQENSSIIAQSPIKDKPLKGIRLSDNSRIFNKIAKFHSQIIKNITKAHIKVEMRAIDELHRRGMSYDDIARKIFRLSAQEGLFKRFPKLKIIIEDYE